MTRPHAGAGTAEGRSRRLVVMRHGITAYNVAGIWQGQLDTPLTPEGEAQAREAAPLVAAYEPSVVVSSDLQRARRTAQIVLELLPGRQLHLDERLREIHVGQWQGITPEELASRFPDAAALITGAEDFRRGVDGETFTEVADRVAPAVDDVLARLGNGETGLVVTHGVVARAIVGDLLGLDRATTWRILGGLGNCHWADVREVGDRWVCEGWRLRSGFGAERGTR